MQRQECGVIKSWLTWGCMKARRLGVMTLRRSVLLLVGPLWLYGVVAAEAKMDYSLIPLDFVSSGSPELAPRQLLNNNVDLAGDLKIDGINGFVKFALSKEISLGERVTPVKITSSNSSYEIIVGGYKETTISNPDYHSDVFRWNFTDGMTILDNLGGNSHAYGMNENGAIVGYSFSTDHVLYGCIWRPGQPIAALQKQITPTAINRAEQIVANILTSNRAALLEIPNFTLIDLLPGGIRNWGRAINEGGQIVGYCQDGSNYKRYGFIWDKAAGLQPLDPTATYPSDPWAINNKSQVVGVATYTDTGRTWAFRWSPATGLVDLNDCIDHTLYSGWYLSEAYGINDKGWIIGVATYNGTTPRTFLLKPSRQGAENGVIVDFGEMLGLWKRTADGVWQQLNTVSPYNMVPLDLNGDGTDELVADYPGYSLYKYDSSNNWQKINDVDPDKMITADIDGDGTDELVAGFMGYGLYYYDDPGGWSPPINTVIPDAMVRYSEGVVCDFGAAYGLWSYNTSDGWVPLNTVDPDKIVAADIDGDGKDELVVSFVGWGLYIYEPADKTWDSINTVLPDKIVAADIDGDAKDELVVSFDGWGLYTYKPEGRIWDPINTEIPESMIRQGNGIAVDYGAAYGLWVWSQGGGWVQRNTVDPGQMTAVDIDNDGVEELVVSFSGFGLYYFDETNGWQLLNAVVPDDMKPINFYP